MKASLKYGLYTSILFTSLTGEVSAADYTVTKIADNLPGSGIFSFYDTNAAINNNGVVTYLTESTQDGPQFIYTSASATPIASCSDKTFESAPKIGDSGNVVVSMQDGGIIGVYNCTSSSFIIDSSGSSFSDFADVAINASDNISFIGDTSINTFSPLVTIADSSGPISSIVRTDINDSGTAMYVADMDSGGQSIFDSTSSTAIFTATNVIPSAAISNSGTVVYTDATEMYIGSSLIPNGGLFTEIGGVAINNNDLIAVSGGSGSTSAIYTYDGSTFDKVIDSNDMIDGSVIGATGDIIGFVSLGNESINDSGQIVFSAQMVSVSPFQLYHAIFVATPVQTFLLGDINEDGVVDTADNLLLTQFVLGTKTPTATELTAGDMNTDGQLNAADMVVHVRTVLGLI